MTAELVVSSAPCLLDSDADGDDACYVARTASRLSDRLGWIVSDIAALVQHEVEDLRDDALAELLYVAVESNVASVLHALRCGISVDQVQAPAPAIEHARRLAQHAVPVNVLVRAYRLSQCRMTEVVFAELQTMDMASEARIITARMFTATLFAYVDRVSELIVGAYEEERQRWLESHTSIRSMRVRELLAGRLPLDVDALSKAIRYPLRYHHLALVMWYPNPSVGADQIAAMQRLIGELGAAADAAAAPLFIAADSSNGWAWLPYRSFPLNAVDVIRRFLLQQSGAPSVAVGSPGTGAEGFRLSHRRAEVARAVLTARGGNKPAIVAADDPGLCAAALLGRNPDEAREWVIDVLGDLAADTASDARLRETLRIFLGCGSSYKAAADELSMHPSTVKYRVRCAITRRGRPINGDRLDVELALLLSYWYGAGTAATAGVTLASEICGAGIGDPVRPSRKTGNGRQTGCPQKTKQR